MKLFSLLLLASTLLLPPGGLKATPYASSVTNRGDSISFRLNEAADRVEIFANGGATAIDLGPLTGGVHAINLTINGPFQVVVSKLSGPGWMDGVALPISDDNSQQIKFWAPRSVAVNTDPASPNFGRIYVANSQSGLTSDGTRSTTDGIYLLNPDLTGSLGQGNVARTGGIEWDSATEDSSKPWRIEVGEDGNLYIADWTTNTGGIFVVDSDVSDGSGINVLSGTGSPGTATADASPNHGQIPSSVIARGSLAAGTLKVYALEGDISPVNATRLWDIGGGPLPYAGPPLQQHDSGALLETVGLTVDLEIGPDGKIYLLQNRFTGTNDGVIIADPSIDFAGGGQAGNQPNGFADLVWFSLEETRLQSQDPEAVDYLRQARAVKISPDAKFMAVLINNGDTWVVPLIDGLPDLAHRIMVPTGGASPAWDIAFDAAGNLYVVNGGTQRLHVFSAGRKSTATTASDGFFGVTVQQPQPAQVHMMGSDTNIYERIAEDTATVTFLRVATDISAPLTVNFSLGGAAVEGIDYAPLGESIVIPAGELSATLSVAGIDNDLFEGDKPIQISLVAGAGYDIGVPSSTIITLRDDESQPGMIIWSDDFETDTSARYNVIYNEGGPDADFLAAFNYDYGLDGIPPAPHSLGGSTRGLKLRVNFDGNPRAASVNVYPLGRNFGGDFALRADLYISVGTDLSGQSEHSIMGIFHSGDLPNRHTNSNDGLWFAIDGAANNNRGFARYVGDPGGLGMPAEELDNTPDFEGIFTSPPWGYMGSPNNLTNAANGTGSGKFWADAEISSVGGVVTFKVNNTIIFSFTNNTPHASGTIMLGQNDQFNSTGSLDNYTLFDNARVVSFGAPFIEISALRIVDGSVIIDFSADPDDTPASFTVQKSATVNGPYTADAMAVLIERASPGLFRATTPVDGAGQFYYIQK